MLRCQKAIIIVSDPAKAITIAISVPLSKINLPSPILYSKQ
jgi:hypothetical protein